MQICQGVKLVRIISRMLGKCKITCGARTGGMKERTDRSSPTLPRNLSSGETANASKGCHSGPAGCFALRNPDSERLGNISNRWTAFILKSSSSSPDTSRNKDPLPLCSPSSGLFCTPCEPIVIGPWSSLGGDTLDDSNAKRHCSRLDALAKNATSGGERLDSRMNPKAPLKASPAVDLTCSSRPKEETWTFSGENTLKLVLIHFSKKPCVEPELSVGKHRMPSRYKSFGTCRQQKNQISFLFHSCVYLRVQGLQNSKNILRREAVI